MIKYSDEIVLSICIPTYNRPKDFERMFLGLIPQLTCEVEIVVRDDSSNNETKAIFDRLVPGNEIRHQYFKGEKIGVDAANLFLIEKASGNYIWWFSDDDEMRPGAIARVLDIVKKYPEISFIWANFAFQEISNLVVDRPDGYFKNGSDVIRSLGVNIGLMSTYIVRAAIGRQGLTYASGHVRGFAFAATAVVLWVLTQPGKFYFLRGPYILCNPTTTEEIKMATIKADGSVVNAGFVTYGIYFYDMVTGLASHFESGAVRKLLTLNFGALWRGMLVGWVGGWDTPQGKRMRMLKLYWSYPECWIALPFFCMPRPIVKIFYQIYKIFFTHRKFVLRARLQTWLNK
jgi:glycosyltransferase involved in cell wall biosynthesis